MFYEAISILFGFEMTLDSKKCLGLKTMIFFSLFNVKTCSSSWLAGKKEGSNLKVFGVGIRSQSGINNSFWARPRFQTKILFIHVQN